MDNTRSDGSPDWDRVIHALMQYRNTPDVVYNLSPSQLVFGRPIRDFLPIQPGQLIERLSPQKGGLQELKIFHH